MAPLIYLDRSEVRDGRLDDLRTAFRDLTRFVEESEPWLASYSVYFSPDARSVSVLHVHADEKSLRRHMHLIRDRLAPFADLLRLRSIEVFGEISEDLHATLQEKATVLGAEAVSVNSHHVGFLRTGASALGATGGARDAE